MPNGRINRGRSRKQEKHEEALKRQAIYDARSLKDKLARAKLAGGQKEIRKLEILLKKSK